jgi:nucleoside-diphosphate-sugar epimerase
VAGKMAEEQTRRIEWRRSDERLIYDVHKNKGARDLPGVALRYGFFYGPGTYHDPNHGSVSEQVRGQAYPVIGSGRGVFSFVHVEDAAAATMAALESDPGVYNVVNDDPSEMSVWLP